MKKWIVTIILAITLLALAIATHFWGSRVIKFAVYNDKTVESLKKLLEFLIALCGLAVPAIKWLFSAADNAPLKGGDTVAGNKNVVGNGWVSGDKVTAIGGDVVRGDKIVYPLIPETPQPSPLHQLPPPPADFTGRATELSELRAAIVEGGVHISGLTGQGGVGKTALALKLAAELAPSFPDAQIYLDLKGVSDKPLTAAEAMSHVLRTFHPEAKLPETEEDLRPLYNSVLYGKRALLLMDNAKDAAQTKPLVPPTDCVLVVTSRRHFALPGLQLKNLETLPAADAEDLLLRVAPRIGSEAEAIARLCGYLPQALRLAASAIAVRVNVSPRDYRRRLEDEKKRLELLTGEDESIEASIALSYGLLDAETQERWRTLGIFADTFVAPAVAFIWQLEEDSSDAILGHLLSSSMLEWNEPFMRYRMHDLMRVFARQRLSQNELAIASAKHSSYYPLVLNVAEARYLLGGNPTATALLFLRQEWANVQQGQEWATAHAAENPDAARLCSAYANFGPHIRHIFQRPRERIRWLEASLAAARLLNDRPCEARDLGSLGGEYERLGDSRKAIEYLEQSLVVMREVGDRQGEGTVLGNLGVACASLGNYGRAVTYKESALTIAREMGDRRSEGVALGNLGAGCVQQDDYSGAVPRLEQALTLARETRHREGEAVALRNLGNVYRILGEPARGVEYLGQGLSIAREMADQPGEGYALWFMSLALEDLGNRREAICRAEAALAIREAIEDPDADEIRKQLDIWRSGAWPSPRYEGSDQ